MPILGKIKNIFSSSVETVKNAKEYAFLKRNPNPSDVWEIVCELGDGAFGKVYKTRHKTQNVFAALKRVDLVEDTDLEDYSVEVEILSACKHKNVVGLHEAYLFSNKLWIYIEFCAGGALDRIMQELERPLNEPQIKYVCREMCEGLDFLHESGVIHRDLKAGNVLLTLDGAVKIADFGVSAKNVSNRERRSSVIGTPYWMAPEVIMCETAKENAYNFKADIWSFGITLIEFAQTLPPHNEMNPQRVMLKIQKSEPPGLQRPSKWSADFNNFLAKCLTKDPEQRPSAGELLRHAFIKGQPDRKPIVALLSEASAEVIVETKDIDESEIPVSGGSSENNSLSNFTAPSTAAVVVNANVSSSQSLTGEPAVVVPTTGTKQSTPDIVSKSLTSPPSSSSVSVGGGSSSSNSLSPATTAPSATQVAGEQRKEPFVAAPVVIDVSVKSSISQPLPAKEITSDAKAVTAPVKNEPVKVPVSSADLTPGRSVDSQASAVKAVSAEVAVSQKTGQSGNVLIRSAETRSPVGNVTMPNFSAGTNSVPVSSQTVQSGPVSVKTATTVVPSPPTSPSEPTGYKATNTGITEQSVKANITVQPSQMPDPKPMSPVRSPSSDQPLSVPVVAGSSVQPAVNAPTTNTSIQSQAAQLKAALAVEIPKPAIQTSPAAGNPPPDNSQQEFRKHYKTLTRTRQFYVDGALVVSQTSKVIAVEDEDEKRKELDKWREGLQQIKRNQKRDNRLLQNLNDKHKQALIELKKSFDQDMQNAVAARDTKIEQLTMAHYSKVEKLKLVLDAQLRDAEKKIAEKQERDVKAFNKKLQTDMKTVKKNSASMQKEQQRLVIEQAEIANIEKERKFAESQQEEARRLLQTLENTHRKNIEPLEREFLTRKHSINTDFENSAWQRQENHRTQEYEAKAQHVREEYRVRGELLKSRQSEEYDELKRRAEERQANLQQTYQQNARKLQRNLREEAKTRSIQFKASQRMSLSSGSTAAQTPEQFEESEKRRTREAAERLEAKNKQAVAELKESFKLAEKELKQFHLEEQKMLAERESHEQRELLKKHQSIVAQSREQLASKLKVLEDEFQRQLIEHAKFYESPTGLSLTANSS